MLLLWLLSLQDNDWSYSATTANTTTPCCLPTYQPTDLTVPTDLIDRLHDGEDAGDEGHAMTKLIDAMSSAVDAQIDVGNLVLVVWKRLLASALKVGTANDWVHVVLLRHMQHIEADQGASARVADKFGWASWANKVDAKLAEGFVANEIMSHIIGLLSMASKEAEVKSVMTALRPYLKHLGHEGLGDDLVCFDAFVNIEEAAVEAVPDILRSLKELCGGTKPSRFAKALKLFPTGQAIAKAVVASDVAVNNDNLIHAEFMALEEQAWEGLLKLQNCSYALEGYVSYRPEAHEKIATAHASYKLVLGGASPNFTKSHKLALDQWDQRFSDAFQHVATHTKAKFHEHFVKVMNFLTDKVGVKPTYESWVLASTRIGFWI